MKPQFSVEIRNLFLLLALSLLVGIALGAPLAGLAGGLFFYLLYLLHQLRQLDQWLSKDSSGERPSLSGVPGLLMDRLVRLQRQRSLETQVLRSALERQNQLISDVRDGVLLVDSRGRIQWFNKSAALLIRLQPHRDPGVPLRGAIRNLDFHSYLDAENYAEPKRICFDDVKRIWVDVSITAYGNGERLIVLRDVSRMQELEEMRRDFVANLSHELRTPVTVLVGYLETLEQPADDRGRRILAEMSRQCERISNLLKDLLTLARLEAPGRQIPVRVDLETLVRRAVADAKCLREFQAHPIHTSLIPGISVRGDEADLISIMNNLLGNAVRHTPPGTRIDVSLTIAGDRAAIEVRDQGPGIERHHLGRLTERFYRVESSRNSATGGTGLGLAIVKHALMRANGELQIESQPGKGSCFRCILPIAPGSGETAELVGGLRERSQ